MLIKLIRKYIGGVRFFMTLSVVAVGIAVVLIDLFAGKEFSVQAYGFLGGMLGAVAVFIWKDTERPVKNNTDANGPDL